MLRNMASVYILYKEKVLLLYRIGSRVVDPSWCGIGGHFEKEELNDAEACVLRELFEETGIHETDINNLCLRYVTIRLKSNEIRQNYYFFAELRNNPQREYICNEGILEWVDKDKALEREMPFTAKLCLKHFLEIGQNTQTIYAGIVTEKGVEFTELIEF